MKQYNVLQALYMSFYSPSLYRDVAANWGGKTFLLLFLLLVLSWIYPVFQTQHNLNQLYLQNTGNIESLVTQIPVLTIKDGKVTTPENRPYVIYAPHNHEDVIAVVDTTGKYTTLEDAKANVLVTENSIISRSKPNEIRTDQIPSTLNMIVDPRNVQAFIAYYLSYTWILLFAFFFLGSYIYRILQAFLYAVIGKILNRICGAKLTYGQMIQISLVAITPVIIFSSILDAFNVTYAYQWLSYFIIAMFYILIGVLANKHQ